MKEETKCIFEGLVTAGWTLLYRVSLLCERKWAFRLQITWGISLLPKKLLNSEIS
jgi:hypothetical protein